jgi:hypothetical protein
LDFVLEIKRLKVIHFINKNKNSFQPDQPSSLGKTRWVCALCQRRYFYGQQRICATTFFTKYRSAESQLGDLYGMVFVIKGKKYLKKIINRI